MAFVRSLPVTLRVSVPVVAAVRVFPRAAHFVIDRDEIAVLGAELDDALRRDVVVLAEKPQFHQVHDVRIAQDDGAPLLTMLVLVVTERAPIGRPRCDRDGDVSTRRA